MRFALAPWLALAVATVACSGKKSAAPVSPGNVVLEISALLPRNDEIWLAPRDPDPVAGDEGYDGDPEPVTIGCDLELGVETIVENFLLRAPDACGGAAQCGYLVVEVDPSAAGAAATARGAGPNVVLDLCALDAGGALPGPHVLRPRLVLADGSAFTAPYAFTPKDVNVTFAEDTCAAPPARCTPAPTGAAGAANAPSEDGAAGAPNP